MLEQASDLYERSSLDLQKHRHHHHHRRRRHHQHVLDSNQCADAASEAILSCSSCSFSQLTPNCGPNHSSPELIDSPSSCQNHARPTHQQNNITSDCPLPPSPVLVPPSSSTVPLLFPPLQGKLWQRFCWFPIFNWEQILLQETSLRAGQASDHSKASSQTSPIHTHGMAAQEGATVKEEPERNGDLKEERSSSQLAGADQQNPDLLVTNSPPWLPDGWITEIRTRRTGCTAGIKRKVFKHLASGRRFRTQKEVFHFLQTGKGRVITRKCGHKAIGCGNATYAPTTSQHYASMVGAPSNQPTCSNQFQRGLGGSLTLPLVWKQLSCTEPLTIEQKSSTQEAMKVLIESEKVMLSFASSKSEEKESSRLWHWLRNPVTNQEARKLDRRCCKVNEAHNAEMCCRETPSSVEVACTVSIDMKPEVALGTQEPSTPIRSKDTQSSRCPTLQLGTTAAPCLQVPASELGKAQMRAELDKVRGGTQNCAELGSKSQRYEMGCAHKSVQGAEMNNDDASKGTAEETESSIQGACIEFNELSGEQVQAAHITEMKNTQWQQEAEEISGAAKRKSTRVMRMRFRDHRLGGLNPKLDLTVLKPGLTSRQRAKQVQKLKAKHAKQLLAILGRELCLRLVHQRGFQS